MSMVDDNASTVVM